MSTVPNYFLNIRYAATDSGPFGTAATGSTAASAASVAVVTTWWRPSLARCDKQKSTKKTVQAISALRSQHIAAAVAIVVGGVLQNHERLTQALL